MIEKKLKTEGGAVIKGESLFNIPYWKIQVINFEEKKKELTKLLESYPEEKRGFQYFFTNRTSAIPVTHPKTSIYARRIIFSRTFWKDWPTGQFGHCL